MPARLNLFPTCHLTPPHLDPTPPVQFELMLSAKLVVQSVVCLIAVSVLLMPGNGILRQLISAVFRRKRPPAAMDLDLLTATADDLQRLLSTNSGFTSKQLVTSYLEQIRRHDDYLRAIINTAPEQLLLQRAEQLDDERKAGTVRGPLHGIPVLLKDNIATSPATGLDTTAGSFALVDSRPRENAILADKVSLDPPSANLLRPVVKS